MGVYSSHKAVLAYSWIVGLFDRDTVSQAQNRLFQPHPVDWGDPSNRVILNQGEPNPPERGWRHTEKTIGVSPYSLGQSLGLKGCCSFTGKSRWNTGVHYHGARPSWVFLVLVLSLAFLILEVCQREGRGIGGGRFAIVAVEVCIGDRGSMDMMPSFCSRCSPSGKGGKSE